VSWRRDLHALAYSLRNTGPHGNEDEQHLEEEDRAKDNQPVDEHEQFEEPRCGGLRRAAWGVCAVHGQVNGKGAGVRAYAVDEAATIHGG